LALLGARMLVLPPTALPYPMPSWFSANHLGTWFKLSLLSLTSFDRIILLDNDCFVLKNIDHLVGVPTPAFVFMTGQLNSGVAVLSPSSTDHTRLHALIRHESYLDVNDRPLMHQRGQQVRHSYMSDQLVWQNLYSPAGFHELPTLYNALPGMNITKAEWKFDVAIMHDNAWAVDRGTDVSGHRQTFRMSWNRHHYLPEHFERKERLEKASNGLLYCASTRFPTLSKAVSSHVPFKVHEQLAGLSACLRERVDSSVLMNVNTSFARRFVSEFIGGESSNFVNDTVVPNAAAVRRFPWHQTPFIGGKL